MQYTIRNIPSTLDSELREEARKKGKSLNQTIIDALKRGLGIAGEKIEYNDLDDLIGSWQKDKEFDNAVAEQDTVDEGLWH